MIKYLKNSIFLILVINSLYAFCADLNQNGFKSSESVETNNTDNLGLSDSQLDDNNEAEKSLLRFAIISASIQKTLTHKCQFPDCSDKFITEKLLKDHIQIKHIYTNNDPNIYICINCGKKYLNLENLETHLVSHFLLNSEEEKLSNDSQTSSLQTLSTDLEDLEASKKFDDEELPAISQTTNSNSAILGDQLLENPSIDNILMLPTASSSIYDAAQPSTFSAIHDQSQLNSANITSNENANTTSLIPSSSSVYSATQQTLAANSSSSSEYNQNNEIEFSPNYANPILNSSSASNRSSSSEIQNERNEVASQEDSNTANSINEPSKKKRKTTNSSAQEETEQPKNKKLKKDNKKGKKLECDHPGCGRKDFKFNWQLNRHKKTHSEIRDFECEICQKTFITNWRLNEHKQTHSETKDFECDYPGCNKAFKTNLQLNRHKNIHLGKIFECEICQKTFSTNTILNDHKKAHLEYFKCEICQKTFSNSVNLNDHKKIHLEIKNFKCDYPGCNKAFVHSSNLTQHKKRHLKIKNFKCPNCQEAFVTTSDLKSHEKNMHNKS